MNVYVETNFVLELVFEQEQHLSCEQIFQLCIDDKITLVVPAYSLAEPHEKLARQKKNRRELQQRLNAELQQLSRTFSYKIDVENAQNITDLMLRSTEEEKTRFNYWREQFLRVGEVVSLNRNTIQAAASYEALYDLTPQDAFVYVSVIHHLQQNTPRHACFLNRNTRDFDNPDIVSELRQLNCKLIPRFDHGYDFIQSKVSSS